MKRTYRWIIAALLLSMDPVGAVEGFSTHRGVLPTPLQSVWDATFYVIGVHGNDTFLGSSFLIGRSEGSSPTTETLHFLTNYHVVSEVCRGQLGTCPDVSLSQEFAYNSTTGTLVKSGQGHVTFPKARVSRFNAEHDLAILSVASDISTSYRFKPVNVGEVCRINQGESVFTMGYPGMTQRPPGPLNSEMRELGLKRWSHGYYLGQFEGRWIGTTPGMYGVTTADALPGNSGGPVVSGCGELLGVSKIINQPATAAEKNYAGREEPDNVEWHSGFIPCETLSRFVRGEL